MSVKLENDWRPITVVNNSAYDSTIQKRTLQEANIVIFANHAEITYTVTNKNLNAYKKRRGKEIAEEGEAILR